MKELAIAFFILVVSSFVFPLVFIIGVLYTTGKHIYKLDYSLSKQLVPIIKALTLTQDGLANSGGGEMLNDVFKIKGEIKYGRWDQTISAVTGLIYLKVKDTKLRRTLDKILGTNHCTDAITEEEKAYYIKLKTIRNGKLRE